MQLTAQQFADVLMSLRSSGSPTSDTEQRRFTRMNVQAKVAVASIVDGKAARCYTVLTQDVSFGGINLMQSVELEHGSRLLVRLPRGEKPPLMMVAVVARCKTLADGLFGIGAKFVVEADVNAAQQMVQAAERERQRISNSTLK
ncbi:MAG: PilZ domain-containing protein [Planctomycetota bacterium]|nr:PilZ domain-containing protein [Planctomycetota bacterium]